MKLGDLSQDLRQGIRMLGSDPAFTALSVFTLALGIGATTAIFSVIDSVLLRPLPYPEPDALVMLRADRGHEGLEGYPALSVTEVDAFQQESELFAGFGRVAGHTIGLTAPDSMEQVPAVTVSPELLEVLGVRPRLGRNFDSRADHHTENGAFPSVLISHELWQRRYGGAADVVGRCGTSEGCSLGYARQLSVFHFEPGASAVSSMKRGWSRRVWKAGRKRALTARSGLS